MQNFLYYNQNFIQLKTRFKMLFLALNCLGAYQLQAQEQAFKQHVVQIPGSDFQISMISLPGGSFRMTGLSSGNNTPPAAVDINVSPFWIGAYEITHDQFGIFFKDEQVSQGSRTDAVTRPTAQYIDLSWNMGREGGFPANSMSQDAALMFCRWLYQKTGIFFRLPTEAEWEYACRAGSKDTYFFGNDLKQLDQYAWYQDNSENKYQKVGQKKPNAWGLYDMLGNLSEWTLDQFDENYISVVAPQPNDPVIPPASRYPRTVRGGSFRDDMGKLTCQAREGSDPSWNIRDPQIPKSRWWLTDGEFVGFRIVRPEKQPRAAEAEKFYTLYLGK
jgi:formylglycine-generating enzyme required for sulfatase activity